MGFRQYVGSSIFVLLFIFCLLIFAIEMIISNNDTSEVLNNTFISNFSARANNTINQMEQVANNSILSLNEDQPSASYLFLIFKSAFYIPRTFISAVINGYSLGAELIFVQIFGVNSQLYSVIFAVFNFILLITLAFLIIKFIRTGESER